LIKAAARSHADLEVLRGIEEHVDAADGANVAPQLLNDLRNGRALVAGLQLDVQVATVDSEARAARAHLAVVGDDVRVCLNDGVHLHLLLDHAVERDVFGAFRATDDEAGVLDWEETLGDGIKQVAGQRDGQQRHGDRDVWMAQHTCKRPFIGPQHRVKAALQHALDHAGFAFVIVRAEKTAAQHRRQRQRDDA
jgi:hypothetical protein